MAALSLSAGVYRRSAAEWEARLVVVSELALVIVVLAAVGTSVVGYVVAVGQVVAAASVGLVEAAVGDTEQDSRSPLGYISVVERFHIVAVVGRMDLP